jgi:hypothetical protein
MNTTRNIKSYLKNELMNKHLYVRPDTMLTQLITLCFEKFYRAVERQYIELSVFVRS